MTWFTFAASNEPTEPTDRPSESARGSAGDEPRRLSEDLLPWAVSLLMHAGLVLLAVFVIWSSATQQPPKDLRVSLDPHDVPPDVPGPTTAPKPDSPKKPTDTPEGAQSAQPLIGNPNNPASDNIFQNATGPAVSTVDTSGSATGKADTIFDTAVTPGPNGNDDPKAKRKGDRIVFVIDASGSLIDAMPFLLRELRKTVLALESDQRFAVIFFRGQAAFDKPVVQVPVPAELTGGDELGLHRATIPVKKHVAQWLHLEKGHLVPGGQTQPLGAIQQALSHKPDLIVMLSDNITGSGKHQLMQNDLLKRIQQMNTTNTQFNTLQFLYPDPLAQIPGQTGTMKRIAEQTGGKYKFISASDVSLGSSQPEKH